jgi:hypothetical protein
MVGQKKRRTHCTYQRRSNKEAAEAHRAERAFNTEAHAPESSEVEGEVNEAGVQEGACEQPARQKDDRGSGDREWQRKRRGQGW